MDVQSQWQKTNTVWNFTSRAPSLRIKSWNKRLSIWRDDPTLSFSVFKRVSEGREDGS